MIYEFEGNTPLISKNAFVAENATIIGKVSIKEESSIWFGAVLRADFGTIEIGKYTCIQDNVVIHSDQTTPTIIGDYCEVGHNAIIHGATIEDCVLIGMGAIVMNGVRVGKGSIVGAGSVVLENTQIPPNSLVVGAPASVKKNFAESKVEILRNVAILYADLMRKYRDGKVKPIKEANL